MKRTLKTIQDELRSLSLFLEPIPKWYRNRSPKFKGMKQFYVKGGGERYWTGSDGESNWSPRVCVVLIVKSISDITLDLVRSQYAKTHEGNTLEKALKEATVAQKKEDKETEKRRIETEAENEVKAKRLATKATAKTVKERKVLVSGRFAEGFKSKENALTFFAGTHSGSILADHYRTEFLELIQNTDVLGMAIDLCTVQYLDLDEMLLLINDRAHKLVIPFESIGGVVSALKFLCQDFAG